MLEGVAQRLKSTAGHVKNIEQRLRAVIAERGARAQAFATRRSRKLAEARESVRQREHALAQVEKAVDQSGCELEAELGALARRMAQARATARDEIAARAPAGTEAAGRAVRPGSSKEGQQR